MRFGDIIHEWMSFPLRMSPAAEEIGALCERLAKYEVVILGTINATAHPAQAELVKKLIKQGTRVITVALRMPYDLAAYPAGCHLHLHIQHPASCHGGAG